MMAGRTRLRRPLAAVTTAGILALLLAPGAYAEITDGPCSGSVTFADTGLTVAASDPAGTAVEIPETATVTYEAAIDIAEPAEPVDVSGEIVLGLPFGSWSVADWSGRTADLATSGTYTYAAPAWVPRGSGPVPIEIVHTHGDVVCRAQLQGAVAGSPWSVTSVLLLLSTAVFGVTMFAAGLKTGRGTGRPVLGLVTGFLFGLLGAASLFAYGAVPLDTPLFWILPLAGIVVGVVLGSWAPFGGEPTSPLGPMTPRTTPDQTITLPDLQGATSDQERGEPEGGTTKDPQV